MVRSGLCYPQWCVAVTQSDLVPVRLLWLCLLVIPPACPQPAAEDFRPDREHPRLLMPAARQRLLRRETERRSMRWQQLETFLAANVPMPEPGMALALYYVASGSRAHGRKAVEWALGQGNDLRQLALVYDWCQPLLTPAESQRLAAKLRKLLAATTGEDLPAVRLRALAAIALAGVAPDLCERQLRFIVADWWRGRIIPALRKGQDVLRYDELHALYELFHVVRDNLNIDLREEFKTHFARLPLFYLLAHYPAPYPAAENDYRVPIMEAHGEPDLRVAALDRAAGLSMVSYDNNLLENQYVQGWLIQDRFLLRGPFGIPYEFLWANPYQPGLSFWLAPVGFHDPLGGRILLRSGWQEDATWFYYAADRSQLFREGTIRRLEPGVLAEPLLLGSAMVIGREAARQFRIEQEDAVTCHLVGLAPRRKYEVEVDDEELAEAETDGGGILTLSFPAGRNAGVRLRQSRAR